MASNDIQYQERQGVYVTVGSGRFVKAPFDVVLLNNEWGVEPLYMEPVAIRDNYLMSNDATFLDDDWFQAREQGYHSLKFRVVELHTLGGAGDGWEGVHQFGAI